MAGAAASTGGKQIVVDPTSITVALNWGRQMKEEGNNKAQDSIEVRPPGASSRIIVLSEKPMIIGRERSSDIWLADAAVSRRHAQLQLTNEGKWSLQDLGSENGTFVNGHQIEYAILNDGDSIRIGDCDLILREGKAAEEEEAFIEFVEAETLPLEGRPAWSLVGRYAELVRKLNHTEDMNSLMQCLTTGCLEMCQARHAAVGTFHGDEISWCGWASEEGQEAAAPDISDMVCKRLRAESMTFEYLPRTGRMKEYKGDTVSGALLFPLRSGGKTYGLLFLEIDPSARPLRRPEAGLVRLAALEAANRMAHFISQEAAEQQARIEVGLNAARRMQVGFFPKTLDIDPRIEIGAVNHPSIVVSGDYYYAEKIDKDHLIFIIADVMGCGLPAAMFVSNFQAGFRLAPRFSTEIDKIHLFS